MKQNRNLLVALCAAVLLGGCASNAQRAPIAADPLEGVNRALFSVHEGIDKVALKPLAQGYDAAVPLPAKMGIGNFFGNFRGIARSGNAFLQGKGEEGMNGLARLFINSTVGIFGLFDVASEMGLYEGEEDFGQTLAVWGVPSGPYLFVPLLGPNTGRDLAGWGVDQYVNPLGHQVDDQPALRNSLVGVSAVHLRATLLPTDQLIEEASLDKYAYIRAAYLQRRASMVRDGKPGAAEDEENVPVYEPETTPAATPAE
ncbi:MAG: VacJ family lipoprotein [Zoogloeaceae bacterium]|jgi:phospholipid-binding lipoprotein MlaA|nr:VacJ family lipoprotein [Zoogloeaceae bacterium]